MYALEINGLCKRYPAFFLDHLSFALPSGCILGLIGENGAGKSTTIKLILDMIHRDSGTVTLWGQDNRAQAGQWKEDVGVVLDEVGFPDCLTPKQIAKIMAGTYRRWDDGAYRQFLSRFSIPEGKAFQTFSRGMKMKLGIAVALSHHPKLLLLDEPTGGLDPVTRDEVVDLFSNFTRDEAHAVLISSHIVSDLEKICDYVAFLHQGKLMLFAEKDALLEQYGVIHCTQAQLAALEPTAIQGQRTTAYGVEAVVRRDGVPRGLDIRPVDMEQLFIFMVKGVR